MPKNCEMCGIDLASEGIKDLLPFCHTCYVERNPQVIDYLKELKEWGACGACGEWNNGEHNCSEEVSNA